MPERTGLMKRYMKCKVFDTLENGNAFYSRGRQLNTVLYNEPITFPLRFLQTVIQELNRLGMVIDLSHSSAATATDAITVSEAPVIFSHSSAQQICNSTRNVPDHLLKLLVSQSVNVLSTEFSIPSCREGFRIIFWEFPSPAWAVASCSSGPQAKGTL